MGDVQTASVVIPNQTEIIRPHEALIADAKRLLDHGVTSPDEDANAVTLVRDLKIAKKEAVRPAADACDAAKKLHTFTVRIRSAVEEVFDDPIERLTIMHGAWKTEQERIAREKEKALAEAARKQEEERVLQAAIDAEEWGEKDEAEKILDTPIAPTVVHVAPAVAKVEGAHDNATWSAEVYDAAAFKRWLGVPASMCHLVEPAQGELTKIAKQRKSVDLGIPGVRGKKTETIVAR